MYLEFQRSTELELMKPKGPRKPGVGYKSSLHLNGAKPRRAKVTPRSPRNNPRLDTYRVPKGSIPVPIIGEGFPSLATYFRPIQRGEGQSAISSRSHDSKTRRQQIPSPPTSLLFNPFLPIHLILNKVAQSRLSVLLALRQMLPPPEGWGSRFPEATVSPSPCATSPSPR